VTDFDVLAMTKEASRLAGKMARSLSGRDPTVQGAALCELVATHLASHVCPGDQRSTDALREVMLEAFIKTVRDLVPIMYAARVAPQLERRH
jgi:hypothetical protein